MIVHRLHTRVNRPDFRLDVVTLKRPTPADRTAMIEAAERAGATSNLARAAFLIAQISGLPLDVVRKLSRTDARELTAKAKSLFEREGLV